MGDENTFLDVIKDILGALGELALVIASFVLISYTFLVITWIFSPTGTGERVGQIIKLSDSGIIYKTHEGELIKGGLSNGSGGFATPLDFTIKNNNQNLLSIANEAFNDNKEVVIYYHTEKHCLTTSDTSNCLFADSIKIK